MKRKTHQPRSVRQQYLSLLGKRPLKPADIHRLEILALLLIHERLTILRPEVQS